MLLVFGFRNWRLCLCCESSTACYLKLYSSICHLQYFWNQSIIMMETEKQNMTLVFKKKAWIMLWGIKIASLVLCTGALVLPPLSACACLINVTNVVNKASWVDALWKMAFNLSASISVTSNFPSICTLVCTLWLWTKTYAWRADTQLCAPVLLGRMSIVEDTKDFVMLHVRYHKP